MPADRNPIPAKHGRDHRPGGADPIPGVATSLTENPAVWGQITRDGGAGSLSITSGAVTSTTTLVDHNVVTQETGVDCDIVSVPSRIVIVEAGLYMIKTLLNDQDSGSGDYGLAVGYGFNATGAVWSPTDRVRRLLGGFATPFGITFQELDIGDYVTQVVGQDSGSTKTFAYLAHLVVARIPGTTSIT